MKKSRLPHTKSKYMAVLSAVGAFILLLGCVLFFHNYTSIVFFAGLLLVIYCMYGWWSDVVTESHIGDHTPVVKIALKYGVIMFIVSEVMFLVPGFGAFLACFISYGSYWLYMASCRY